MSKQIDTKSNKHNGLSAQTDGKKQALLIALEETLGNMTRACGIVGIHRSVAYDWLKSDSKFKAAVEDVQKNAVVDHVESKLMDAVDELKTPAIIYWLNNRGSHRGWSNEQYLNLKQMPTIQVNAQLPDDLLKHTIIDADYEELPE